MTDVWTYKLQNHSKLKNILLQQIESAEHSSSNVFNDKIYRTDYYRGIGDDQMEVLQDRKYFWFLYNECREFYETFRKKYCICGKSTITNLWFQQYLQNDIHDWHVHGNSNISFVYFLELPDNSCSTQFFDLEKRKIFQPKVSEGDIIVFPSHIPHRSPLLKSNKRKTIISWNMSLDLIDTTMIS